MAGRTEGIQMVKLGAKDAQVARRGRSVHSEVRDSARGLGVARAVAQAVKWHT